MMKFFKEDKDSLLVDVNYLEVYIPKDYFDDNKIAAIIGNTLSTFGIFYIGVFNSENDSFESGKIYNINIPSTVVLTFTDSYYIKRKLKNNIDEKDYLVLTYKKNDMFIENLNVIKDGDNVDKFVKMLFGGKVPEDVPYSKVLELFKEISSLNGMSFGSSVISEFVLSELYRSKSDISKPLRLTPGGNYGENDYKAVNIKTIPSLNSTFTAISFEDINQSIISSIKKTRENEDEIESPIEKVIKY